ncbi:MAG TPA: alpha/beta fold hydrolase [Firmicutes bacterium]|jgi:pimeloyl-ACP methyl ester carboxylesterase|nr:alpha/beta fold hydrolase [Bacillota bacterium]
MSTALDSGRMRVRPLLSYTDDQGNIRQITTPEEWANRRTQLRGIIEYYLGEAPPLEAKPPVFTVLEEKDQPEYKQMLISYEVEPGEIVKAHLLIPPKEKRRCGAAVLCQHGTSTEAKDTQLGAGAKRNRDWGCLLAKHGFIILAPDHVCAGERQPADIKPYDTSPFAARYPKWSATGKAIWDAQRALDVLCRLEEVDPQRLGTIGHSLGGYSSIFLAAFDERVRAAVSSCGLTSWQDNPKKLEFARDRWYVHFPRLREPFLRNEIPFDMHEFAALIAPRPFLNISGMADKMYSPSNDNMPEIGYQLSQVWSLLGAGEGFANFLTGTDHDVPDYVQALAVAWMVRWLCE